MADASGDRSQVHTAVIRWVAIGLAIAAGLMIWPLWQPLVLACWFAVLARPLMERLERIMRGLQRAAAVIITLLLLLVLVPLGLFLASLVSAAVDLVQTMLQSQGGRQALEAVVSGSGKANFHMELADIVVLLQQYGEQSFELASSIAGATATGLLGVFVFVLAAYSFLADGAAQYRWLENNLPITPRNLRRFATAFNETGRGLLIGVGLTGLIQGAVATVAFLALGIPRAFVLGVLTALASFIPSVGTALVWVPVAVGLALTGDWVRAIIMAAVGVLVIGLIDNFLRPMLSRHGSVRLPTLVLLVAMFGGLAVMGAWGLLLGPLLVRLAMEAVAIEREDRTAGSDTERQAGEQNHA
jgi:predicted PurR-regulated permease PerM